MARVCNKASGQFVEWIPNRVLSTISEVNSSLLPMSFSGGLIANSTCVASSFKRTLEQFGKMFKRKAYLHSYLAEGMDEAEFLEAEANLQDLVAEYQQYEQMEPDSGSEDDQEDMAAELLKGED